jgi:gamma-glutamyl hercynylcysteine S-oxide synthase
MNMRDSTTSFTNRPWIMLSSGEVLGFPEGFIPRLVSYTWEDKAAKGLRSLKERAGQPEKPIHFSALEVIQENRCTLLTAPAGGGKTAMAMNLLLSLRGEIAGDAQFGHRHLAGPLPRNDQGDVIDDGWRAGVTLPVYSHASADGDIDTVIQTAGSAFQAALARSGRSAGGAGALLIIDGLERIGTGWAAFAASVGDALETHQGLRILLLGDSAVVNAWPLPAGVVRHGLLPLLTSQRRWFEADVLTPRRLSLSAVAMSDAAAHPALFALAQRLTGDAATAERIVDGWSAAATVEERSQEAENCFLQDLLAARELSEKPLARAAELFRGDLLRWTPVIASLLNRLAADPDRAVALIDLITGLPGDAGLRGALLAGDLITQVPSSRSKTMAVLLRLIEEGRLTAPERASAGRILAIQGDPRDLEALAEVTGGSFVMGSVTHPNSLPVHQAMVSTFRIGVYPVTNASYRAFVEATGRPWPSADGHRPDRSNAPVVDLTWHDARACCAWLTQRWRVEGRIHTNAIVRLPTEPEWERAARGDQPDRGQQIVYPWGTAWADDIANAETAGFNDTTAVGLFPRGRSAYGCHDMVGQVWEWCSTLWGKDMAAPAFAYPYRNDGREASDAPDSMRRVLRGGCFSSSPQKACATYRGSLEANGFWRGNGFRIVVQ